VDFSYIDWFFFYNFFRVLDWNYNAVFSDYYNDEFLFLDFSDYSESSLMDTFMLDSTDVGNEVILAIGGMG
jgi:hypothetical protein